MDQSKLAAEQAIRAAVLAHELERATELVLDAFGEELLSFLAVRLGTDGEVAFYRLTESIKSGLGSFDFGSSLAAWLYARAVSAGAQHEKAQLPPPRRTLSVALGAAVTAVVQHRRRTLQPRAPGDARERLRGLQQRMSVEDRTLLVLHIDRGLPWAEVAQALSEEGVLLHGESLLREAARLEARFARVKLALRELAIAEGLFKPRGTP